MELRKQADTRHVGESRTPGPKVSPHEGPFADQLLKLFLNTRTSCSLFEPPPLYFQADRTSRNDKELGRSTPPSSLESTYEPVPSKATDGVRTLGLDNPMSRPELWLRDRYSCLLQDLPQPFVIEQIDCFL